MTEPPDAAERGATAASKAAPDSSAVQAKPPTEQPAAPDSAQPSSQGGSARAADPKLQAALAASAMDEDGWQVMPDGSGTAAGGGKGTGEQAGSRAAPEATDRQQGSKAAHEAAGRQDGVEAAPEAKGRHMPAASSGDEKSLGSADTQPLSEALQFLEDIGAVSSPPRGRKRRKQSAGTPAASGAVGDSGSGGSAARVADGLPAAVPAPMDIDLPAARQQPPDCKDRASTPQPGDGPRPDAGNGGNSGAAQPAGVPAQQAAPIAEGGGSHAAGSAANTPVRQPNSSSAAAHARAGQEHRGRTQAGATAAGGGRGSDAAGPSNPELAEMLSVLGSDVSREQVEQSQPAVNEQDLVIGVVLQFCARSGGSAAPVSPAS